MKNGTDIEIGTALLSKTPVVSGSEGIMHSTRQNDPSTKKRINWLLHVSVFFISSGIAAGIGYAAYAGQKVPQMVSFQTQFDG